MNAIADTEAWYCLRSHAKHERIAGAHLRKVAGVEVFAPMLRYQRARRQGGKTWVMEAMFPSYLFARFNLGMQSRHIQHSHGVSGIVRFGDKYPSLPAEVIERLREFIGASETVIVPEVPETDAEVTITETAFHGLRVLVTQYFPAKERVRVLLTMLGREMEVELPLSSVAMTRRSHPLQEIHGLTRATR